MASCPLRSRNYSPSPLLHRTGLGLMGHLGPWSEVLLPHAGGVGSTQCLAGVSVGTRPHLEPSPVGTFPAESGAKKTPQGPCPLQVARWPGLPEDQESMEQQRDARGLASSAGDGNALPATRENARPAPSMPGPLWLGSAHSGESRAGRGSGWGWGRSREKARYLLEAAPAALPGTLRSGPAAGASARRSAGRGAGSATGTRPPRAALGTARYSVHFQLKEPTYRTHPLKAIPGLLGPKNHRSPEGPVSEGQAPSRAGRTRLLTRGWHVRGLGGKYVGSAQTRS